MRIVIVSNFVNHYYAPLAEELYRLTNGQFWFVEVEPLPESFKKGGFSIYDRPYILRAWESAEAQQKAYQLAVDADVMYTGGGKFVVDYEKRRLKYNKLTLECAERILKRGLLNALSPTNLLTQFYYHTCFYKKPLYKLCISGYTANDMYLQHAYKDKCYKWAYFPAIPELDPKQVLAQRKGHQRGRMIWCARFLKWKHPELPVLLAEKLRDAGYDFEINMIGSGELHDDIARMIERKNLQNYVHLLGNFPNAEVTKIMADHDIFLFTSDRHEGWGVVLNEAMGQVCCPVASHLIGAVPFLLKDGENGMVFASGNVDSLYGKVRNILEHPDMMRELSLAAYRTVHDTWNPIAAAHRFYEFCEGILQGNVPVYSDGPLSKATPHHTHVKDLPVCL